MIPFHINKFIVLSLLLAYSFVVMIRVSGLECTEQPTYFESQFQVELGRRPNRKVAGAGVPQPRLPRLCVRVGLRGLQGHRPLAGQQCGEVKDLPGREGSATRWPLGERLASTCVPPLGAGPASPGEEHVPVRRESLFGHLGHAPDPQIWL